MAFDPKRHLIKVQGGRQYLPVSARLIWFRSEHPDWGIVTDIVEINHEKQYAIFRATIFNEDGRLIATGTKREDVKGFGDFIEKAETGSIGRALALCGYGTQFEPEFAEGGFGGGGMRSGPPPQQQRFEPRPSGPPQRLGPPSGPSQRRDDPMDEPFAERRPEPMREAARPEPPREREMARPEPPMSRPAPVAERAEPPMRQAARPAPAPIVEDDDDDLPPPPDLDSLGLKPASSVARPAPRQAAPPVERAEPPARPAARPAPAGAAVQRVREPERDLADPGGDDDDFEDPFAEEEAPAPPPTRPAARPAARKPASDRLL
ncbi:MAG: hypothetical protein QM758_18160 [Armatimonas sp.]